MQILEHILKIRREKAKHEFSQTVGNQLATIWHCEMWFANFALPNSPTTKHCSFVSHKNAKPLRKFALPNLQPNSQPVSHCEIRCGISHCEISHCEIRCGFSHCEIRNVVFRIAKFAMWFFALRNSLWFFALRNFALRNSLWFFALRNSQHLANSLRTDCENSHCFDLRFCFAHNFFIRTPF